MTIERKVGMGIAGQPTGGAVNVADVFSTYLYTGTGANRSIVNGIDLAGEGGMVWFKDRNTTNDHMVFDTERGVNKYIFPSYTGAEGTAGGANALKAFNSDGFDLGSFGAAINPNNQPIVSWTFRKAPKFFTCLTYTGNSVAGRALSHDLGAAPAMVMIKCTSDAGDWLVWHKNGGGGGVTQTTFHLNTTAAGVGTNYIFYGGTGALTDTTFGGLGPYDYSNESGKTYVAYLFADNSAEDADDQMIKCGSYTGNNSNIGPYVSLGWEPQFVLIKSTQGTDAWVMFDSMRGLPEGRSNASSKRILSPNSSSGEGGTNSGISVDPDGFHITGVGGQTNDNNYTYIYMAIRAPMMKKPSAATEVFNISTYGANRNNSTTDTFYAGFPVDMALKKNPVTGNANNFVSTRMLGTSDLSTNHNGAERTGETEEVFDSNTHWNNAAGTSTNNYSWMWKRAKGYFDVVAYKGTGSPRTLVHSLGVVPEMIVCKSRSTTGGWQTYHKTTGNTKYLYWNQNYPAQTSSSVWNNTTPTDSVFTVGNGGELNGNNIRYVAYLFATLAGISKVGSYTGTGSDINVDCGFSAGARFILIKRTDATGEDWIYYDTVRGIVAGVDPFLKLNETNQQNAGNDGVDPLSSGFTVTSSSGNNTSGGTYIFYAIA